MVDAVVVPSTRGAERLWTARELASSLSCELLVLCSEPADMAAVSNAAQDLTGAVAVVDDRSHAAAYSGLRTALHPLSGSADAGAPVRPFLDVGAKRNLALLVARRMRWQTVLFLDDDVHAVTPEDVCSGAAELSSSPARAAGWPIVDWPDNSVVCHARREAGWPQTTFVGGGALLVDVRGPVPFFPPVYNEDWFFLIDWVRTGRVLIGEEVRQLAYDPFTDPARARREEFGDVLAEGLYNLLHEDLPLVNAYLVSYWAAVLESRRSLIETIRLTLAQQETNEPGCRTTALQSLQASVDELLGITPASLVEYVAAWRRDLLAWNVRMAAAAQLPAAHHVVDALGWLGVQGLPFGPTDGRAAMSVQTADELWSERTR